MELPPDRNQLFVIGPEILESTSSVRPLAADIQHRKILIGLLFMVVLTGGALSWFSSSNPDGLEWSLEKTFGKPKLPEQEHKIMPTLQKIQESTAFLPDYGFRKSETKGKDTEAGINEQVWPKVDAGTSLSGVVGSLIVIGMVLLIGFSIRAIRKKPKLQ